MININTMTRIENTTIYSDVVYPDLISDKRKYKVLGEIDEENLRSLIGRLKIGNKYLVFIGNMILYQHDDVTFECVRL